MARTLCPALRGSIDHNNGQLDRQRATAAVRSVSAPADHASWRATWHSYMDQRRRGNSRRRGCDRPLDRSRPITQQARRWCPERTQLPHRARSPKTALLLVASTGVSQAMASTSTDRARRSGERHVGLGCGQTDSLQCDDPLDAASGMRSTLGLCSRTLPQPGFSSYQPRTRRARHASPVVDRLAELSMRPSRATVRIVSLAAW